MWDRSREERAARSFERNRIAALERGLELRGETGRDAGRSHRARCSAASTASGAKIGSGGIGVVYAAEHVTLGHEVAVKVLRGAAARDGGEIARLRREAYIQVHVEHPNVVRVLDLDQMPDGSIYVVMERLDRAGRSPTSSRATGCSRRASRIPVFIDVCRALHAAHKKGVVHRDLKPGNIFLLRGRHRQGARLRHEQARERRVAHADRATRWARPSTWRPSSASARRSSRGRTSTRSAS